MRPLNYSFSHFVALLLFACVCCHAHGDGDLESAPLDSYQTIPTGPSQLSAGFLRYKGVHHSRRIIVQAFDSGSAGPGESLCVYIQDGEFYRLVLGMPAVGSRGFRCTANGDQLKIFWTGSKNTDKSKDSQPFMTIDIGELLTAFTKA